jgi:hypothetical protein
LLKEINTPPPASKFYSYERLARGFVKLGLNDAERFAAKAFVSRRGILLVGDFFHGEGVFTFACAFEFDADALAGDGRAGGLQLGLADFLPAES